MTKRTYHPSLIKKLKTHGFRSRNKTKKRRGVIKRKILRGRRNLY